MTLLPHIPDDLMPATPLLISFYMKKGVWRGSRGRRNRAVKPPPSISAIGMPTTKAGEGS